MTHKLIIRLYRLQGRLAGLRSRAIFQETLNERLREAADSRAACQAYSLNFDQSARMAVKIDNVLTELEQITRELEDAK